MQTVSITVLERWIANGSFNPERMAEGDYSGSTAILILLNPNREGTELKSASIGLIVRRQWDQWGTSMTSQSSSSTLVLKDEGTERLASDNACRTFCIIVGDYGGHMGFATDLPFCMAYPLSFVHKDDPTQMTFRSQQNHPTSFTADVLLVHQLLTRDCPLREYVHGTTCQDASLFPEESISHPTSFHGSFLCEHVAP